MLTKEETEFINYWERNRLRRKKVVRQFLLGVPIGLLFAVPIVINLFSGWDKHADMEANSPEFDPRVLFVALLLIVGFTSIFWQRHKWDQYEQRYRELIARRGAADVDGPHPIVPSAADPESGLPIGLEWESSRSEAVGPDESPAE